MRPARARKLERYHVFLTPELVGKVRFRSLSHFRRELYDWRAKYDRTGVHGGICWSTPHEVYHDPKIISKKRVRGR